MPKNLKKIIEFDVDKQLEESRKLIEKERQELSTYLIPADILATRKKGKFNFLSLEVWLAVAEVAEVPFIPIKKLGCVNRDDLCAMLDNAPRNPNHVEAFDSLIQNINAMPYNDILRWDFACGEDIKYMMHKGNGWDHSSTRAKGYLESDSRKLNADDYRIFDMILDYCSATVPLFSRPWIQANSVPGLKDATRYPVEWRVFVNYGEVKAVSFYYPQASISNYRSVDSCLHSAKQAAYLTTMVIDTIKALGFLPANPHSSPEPEGIGFTLDFLEREDDGSLILLEGGPPFGKGAHPCCFLDSTGYSARPVEGIALSQGGEIYPLN